MEGVNSIMVTGTNRGIGLELVRQLTTGPTPPKFIIATCRNPATAEELQQLAKANSSIHVIALDVANEESFQLVYEQVEKIVGDVGLDILFNNAGILCSETLDQVTSENVMKSFKINTVAPLILSKMFLPLIRRAAARKPRTKQVIVNVSSQLSSMADNILPGLVYPYKLSKVALNSVSVQMADDLRKDGIIVFPLCPGHVKTDMGGKESGEITAEECVSGIINLLNNLKLEVHSGKFYNYAGVLKKW